MPVVNFYVKQFFKEQIYPEFKRICTREGISVSEKLVEYVTHYTELHREGNPQQTLPKIMEIGGPYIAPLKCEKCHNDATHEFHRGKESWKLCFGCLKLFQLRSRGDVGWRKI